MKQNPSHQLKDKIKENKFHEAKTTTVAIDTKKLNSFSFSPCKRPILM